MYSRNVVPQFNGISPQCHFKTNTTELEKQAEQNTHGVSTLANSTVIDINSNMYQLHQKQQFVGQQLNDRIVIDAKLLQSHSEIGAMHIPPAHRQVGLGAVQYGMM